MKKICYVFLICGTVFGVLSDVHAIDGGGPAFVSSCSWPGDNNVGYREGEVVCKRSNNCRNGLSECKWRCHSGGWEFVGECTKMCTYKTDSGQTKYLPDGNEDKVESPQCGEFVKKCTLRCNYGNLQVEKIHSCDGGYAAKMEKNFYGIVRCLDPNGGRVTPPSNNNGNGNGGGGNPGGRNSGGGSSNVSGPCGNEIRTTSTAGRGAYIVHWYRVKGWGGTYPGNGTNDFNCTMAGKHLDIYEEDGTWYARGPNKCVPESKRPGCTQAYPEGQAPVVKPGDDSKKKCEDSFGTWTNGACVCDANKNLIKDATGFCACKGEDYVRVPASKSCEMTDTAKLKTLCEAAATSGAVWNGTECTCPEENKDWNGVSCVVSVAYEQCKSISDATWNAVTKKCVCNDETKAVNAAGTKCEEKAEYKQKRELGAATKSINAAVDSLKSFAGGLDVSKWKDEEGKFNTARLASDVTAGVVLGTAGALITSSVVKKHQVEDGFEDISCTIGGQTVAGWGDEFTVGVH